MLHPPLTLRRHSALVAAAAADFFINLIDQSGFGDSHLCWGKIGPDGMQLVDM